MNKLAAVLAAVFVMMFVNTAFADEDDNPDWNQQQQAGSSGIGESCRRRNDCKAGLKCVKHACTDPHEGETCGATADCGGGELKCLNQKCTSPGAPVTTTKGEGEGAGTGDGKAEPHPSAPTSWMQFRLDDGNTHPFIGIVGLLGGFGITGVTGPVSNFNAVNFAGLFALKAGVIVGGHHEIGVELTPFFTALPMVPAGPVFELNASYGYLIPIADHVSWPIRIGAGIMAGPSPNAQDLAWFEIRADLVGVNINIGHLLIDLHLPSFRYFLTDSNGTTGHVFNWLFGASFGYAL